MNGVVFTAYSKGNHVVPYPGLALLNACLVRRFMNVGVTLFADHASRDWIRTNHPEKLSVFDQIIEDDRTQEVNLRLYAGFTGRMLQFNNRHRARLYHRVPYEEILLLDTDYLIYNDSLNLVWNSRCPIRMNRITASVHQPLIRSESRVGISIPQFWATATYLRRSSEADKFIRLVEYAEANYEWFSQVYRFERNLYRNDFTFSIAAHLLGGQTGYCPSIEPLPNDVLLFSWDEDRVLASYGDGLLIHAKTASGYDPVRVRDTNVHVLNKTSMISFLDEMIEYHWRKL